MYFKSTPKYRSWLRIVQFAHLVIADDGSLSLAQIYAQPLSIPPPLRWPPFECLRHAALIAHSHLAQAVDQLAHLGQIEEATRKCGRASFN